MTDTQKIIRYAAIALAVFLIIAIIGGILAAAIAFFDVGSAVGEIKSYRAESEISSLNVDIGASDFKIERGEEFFVESNLNDLEFKQTGGKIVVKEKSFGSKNYNGAFVTVFIPESVELDRIDITTGAGKFTADRLIAEEIYLKFGAGEVSIGELVATHEAVIVGGAGQITVGGGSLKNLQFDMGVGELCLASRIVDSGEFNLGVGEASITLLGGREGYTVEMNRGIGSINFDGESISSGSTVGNGKNKVEINGGVGSIIIEFKE